MRVSEKVPPEAHVSEEGLEAPVPERLMVMPASQEPETAIELCD